MAYTAAEAAALIKNGDHIANQSEGQGLSTLSHNIDSEHFILLFL